LNPPRSSGVALEPQQRFRQQFSQSINNKFTLIKSSHAGPIQVQNRRSGTGGYRLLMQ
jgi:hypothetical protein